jgi:putative ABC transport system permease protein
MEVGFPEAEFLAVRLEMDREPPAGAPADTSRAAFDARFRAAYAGLERRLEADPAVAGVTFGDRLPRMYHPSRLVAVDAGGAAPLDSRWPGGYRVSSASVGPEFFEVLQAPVLSGRGFHSGDHGGESRAVIVNQSFVRLVLGGRNPIGRRVQYRHFEEWDEPEDEKPAGPWHEIVGVVPDMGMSTAGGDPKIAGIYHPVAAGGTYPAQMAVRVRGDPASFTPRLRALATEVDPTLRLYEPVRMDQVSRGELKFIAYWFRLLLGVSGVALVLSLAGIYAVTSFTVARRTREIGIRVALGANPRRVAAAIFRRPLMQVALGVLAGTGILALLMFNPEMEEPTPRSVAALAAYAALMMAICMLACVVPTRRALRVQPTEALRAES